MGNTLHAHTCEFLRPDGIACTCGSFEREIARAKLPGTADIATTEEPDMPDVGLTACPPDKHSLGLPSTPGQMTSTAQRAGAICEHAANLVNGDRNVDYGDARENFTETGKLWAVVLGLDEITAEQVALCLDLLKTARLIHNPNHADSWVDKVGYSALGGGIASTPDRYL